MNSPNSGATQQYQQIGNQTGVMNADAHRLTQMLFESALKRIALAKGQMQRKDVAGKGENISKAISVVEALRGSLDMDKGEELAANLDALYLYISQQLLKANIANDEAMLEEVSELLRTVKSGWDGIREEALQFMGAVPSP